MNSLTITNILRQNRCTRSKFLACAPCDAIPSSNKFPHFLIVNTEKSSKSGKHWVLLWIENPKMAIFFDSFGRPPNACIQQYLNKFDQVYYSRKCVQSALSKACGMYCIIFGLYKCKGWEASKIINLLHQLPFSFMEKFLA